MHAALALCWETGHKMLHHSTCMPAVMLLLPILIPQPPVRLSTLLLLLLVVMLLVASPKQTPFICYGRLCIISLAYVLSALL